MEIVFVLVAPAVPENVGAAARAIKTMGFDRLRVVASDAHRDKRARILAHGAGDVLAGIEAFDDLAAALADCSLAVATTARERAGKRSLYAPAELRGAIASKPQSLARVAVVFGCEESGLSNAQLALCDMVSAIPLAQPYPSLNLSQAVMLYAYELSSLAAAAVEQAPDQGEWQALKSRVTALLTALQYRDRDKLWRWATERLPLLGDRDVRFAHLLLTRLQRALTDSNTANNITTTNDKEG